MPVEPQNYVTHDEVKNSYEFKLMRRILLREFPWIKDVVVPTDEEINQYGLIFVDLVMDPFELQRETGWPLATWIKFYMTLKDSPFTTKPWVYQSSYLSTIFDEEREASYPIHKEIESTIRSVERSAAIPHDLKIGKDRAFAIGQYVIPQMKIPEDAVFKTKTS